MNNYIASLYKMGSLDAYSRSDGSNVYLRHSTVFTSDDVKTDGKGNVIDMPLLENKPCFGRPERYIRQSSLDIKFFRSSEGGIVPCETRCCRCDRRVQNACEDLVFERLESDTIIGKAIDDFLYSIGKFPDRVWTHKNRKLWRKFLDAVRDHGGWSNVNDERIPLAKLERRILQVKKRRESAALKRRSKRLSGNNPLSIRGQIRRTSFLDQLDMEAQRRLEILLRLRDWSSSPLKLKRLPEERCRMTVEVWKQIEYAKFCRVRLTGKDIACRLLRHGAYAGQPASMAARVSEARQRIQWLEDDRSGSAVWMKFNPILA